MHGINRYTNTKSAKKIAYGRKRGAEILDCETSLSL
jgi:hypothetical protein